MALGSTNISTGAVNTELGSPYTTPRLIKNLCTYTSMNPFSFGTPGYWDIGATGDKFIFWQLPRGTGYTDPRGTYNGTDKESYHLGDFRYYNHSAITPYCNFPAGTTEYGYGTSTATGLSRTVYVGEMDWKQTLPEHYSENDWATMTNVHLLDAFDDSIAGTASIPVSGGNANISITAFSISPAGTPVTKTYHVAFGIDATHWSFKMGTDQGLGGIGTITALQLAARAQLDADWTDAATTNITGGANDPYTDVTIPGGTTESFSGTNVAIWQFDGANPSFRCWYNSGASYDDYTRMNADWLIKGFKDEPTAEYIVGTAQIYGNSGNNSVTLPAGGLTRSGGGANSPNTFSDGDNITLIFENITIVL